MLDDNGYDSSDEEFEQKANPYVNAGKASLDWIVDNAVQNRRASKIFEKQLQPTYFSPKSTYNLNLWGNRFSVFLKSLGVKPGTIPTDSHLCRFFATVPEMVVGQGKDGMISLKTVQSGFQWVINWCRFHFTDWKLSSSGGIKLKSIFATLINEDRITLDPAVGSRGEKQWVTSDIVRQLVSNYLQDCIETGCQHWDRTILNVLTMLLLSSTGARAGDVAVSQGYEKKGYCLR
ncbi:hypothetical protein FSARC_13204 [Fusarium sarcochroum]|uniref:Uncharacterized protein n=1 Tax=Fusarium sarcochroum TaxID=1208366 RepID=A0A8H4T357_9HYPO|nr:hypothetical protein FSARC_13204 [Fusarium sarcochroum]